MRDSFDDYEIHGSARTANHEYKSAKGCKRQKTCDNAIAHSFSDKEAFTVNTFITINNKLKNSLEHRIEGYENIDKIFSVLTNFSPNISSSEVSEGIRRLCQKYPDNLPIDFIKEFLQFVEFTSPSDIERKDDESKSIWMYRVITEPNVIECFPNVETALELYLSLMITNCNGECSCSLLTRVKNVLDPP
ncbi:unnamed protein product [Caretta caretta]